MDGVLVDSEALHWKSVLEVLRIQMNLQEAPSIEPRIGWGDIALWTEFKERYMLQPTPKELTALRSQCVEVMLKSTPPPLIPHALEGVKALKAIAPHLPFVIVSASPREQMRLSLSKFAGLFDFMISGVDDCLSNKPSPLPYLTAAKSLGVPPTRCWVLEDSSPGLSAALDSGANVFAVCAHSADPQLIQRCVAQLDSLSELIDYLNHHHSVNKK